MSEEKKIEFIAVESPYNAVLPWNQLRNIQYAILANTHAASFKDAATWTPHICNTQIVKFGYNTYIGDTYGTFLMKLSKNLLKYYIGREDTLRITNGVRQTHIDRIVCYTDFGISSGMKSAIDVANANNIPVEMRKLPPELLKEVFGQSFLSTILPTVTFIIPKVLMCIGLYYVVKSNSLF